MGSRAMKDSGVEWIGEIPDDWEVSKFKYAMKKEKTLVGSYNGENVLSLTKQGVIVRDLENPTGKMPASFDGYQHAEKDDLLLCLFDIDVTPRCVGIVKNNGITSPAYSRYRVSKKFSKEFLNYFLTYIDDEKILLPYTKSLRNTLTDEYFGMVNVLYPSIEAQQKIATFLDQKTTHIDSIIEKTKTSIDSFKRYKQALITETVTKGLNPDVPMKDSGIEWIGMIPAYWEVRKMKTLGTSRNGLTYSPDEVVDDREGTLVLRSSNVQNGRISLEDTVYVAKEVSKSLMVEKGDILICSRNGSRKLIGKNAIIEGNMVASFGAFMMIFKSNQNSKYLYYILNSEVFNFYLGTFLSSTINQLTKNNFQNMEVVFCANNKEQEKIVAFLDEKTAHIDRLIQNKEAMIEKLEAYKKSLIYEYVTGKKEVE